MHRYSRARCAATKESCKAKKRERAAIDGRWLGSMSQHVSSMPQISSLICQEHSLLGRPPDMT